MQDKLYIKYRDCNDNFHYQSISDLLSVGALIELEGTCEGDDMEIVDDNLYRQTDNKNGFVPIESWD